MVDPGDAIKAFVVIVVVVAGVGAVLNIDTSGLIEGLPNLFAALFPGIVIGAVVAAIVAAITRNLPAGLLFGGLTATALTIILRVAIWIDMHTSH